MNSIILRRSRFLLNLLPQRQQLFFIPIPTLSSFFPAFPLPLDDLKQLLSPWLRAVPKSKTSHSKKKMRSSNKGLKEQQGALHTNEMPEKGRKKKLTLSRVCCIRNRRLSKLWCCKTSTSSVPFLSHRLPSNATPKRKRELGRERDYHSEFSLKLTLISWACLSWLFLGCSGVDHGVD